MKQHNLFSIFSFFITVSLTGTACKAQSKTNNGLEEARKAILAANAIYFDLYAKNDGSVLRLYTEDACLMPPNAPAICGREALQKDFKDTYAAGVVRGGKFTTMEVYGDGNEYVTEEGRFQVFDGNEKLIDEGKVLRLWKKTKEGWKLFRDSFNSDHK